MALSQTEAKYINQSLAYLLERAMKYTALAQSSSKSSRDKAIWRAIALDAARAFNFVLRTMGTVGTSKLAEKQQLYINEYLTSTTLASVVTEREVENLIKEIYDNDSPALRAQEALINQEKLEAQAITVNCPNEVKEAFTTLAERGVLGYVLNSPELLKKPVTFKNAPRGNPLLGAFVRKYKHEGYLDAEAKRLAEIAVKQKLADDEAKFGFAVAQANSAPATPTDVAMTVAQAYELANKKPKKDPTLDLVAMLSKPEEPSFDDFVAEEDLRGD